MNSPSSGNTNHNKSNKPSKTTNTKTTPKSNNQKIIKTKNHNSNSNQSNQKYTCSTERKNQNAFTLWTRADDDKLRKLYSENMSIYELANIFGRSNNAIVLRIKKLKLSSSTDLVLPLTKPKYNFWLYHFTDPRNIPSIKKYGLLSWEQLLNRNIYHYQASNQLSRDLDVKHDLSNYVRLTLSKNHPMFDAAIYYNRVSSLVWLKIKPDVIDLNNTLFSNTNATSNLVIVNSNKETAFSSSDIQAEVLIKEKIDQSFIIF